MRVMVEQFKNIDDVINNFDSFCDSFESRAAEAFLRGDQNNGRVTGKAEQIGTGTPDAVREVQPPGPTDLDARAAIVDVPTT